ncbi:MAG: glycosyltransferase [Lachnospiraceae bacterium]|jgi:dolichol-phosphate mannosyltransferase|nr:glycosyltransferase [Lachnospiraceae bacterium]
MEKKFISLVVYLHDAAPYLKYFLDTVLPVFEKNFQQYEVVCVDDASVDGTTQVLREYVESRQVKVMVSVVHMSFFQGLESAMNAGRDIAIGDFVYEFDDIFVDYEPEVILEVYRKLIEGSDIVAASSRGKMRTTSRIFYALYNKTSRGNGRIGPETFRIVSRRAINRIKSIGQYIPYRKAVYMNCGLKTATISYESCDVDVRIKNKTVSSERTALAFDSFIYFTNVLERISAIICGVFLVLTVGMGFYLVGDFFNGDKPVEGWLSTMGFLALGFFGVFALLTIILKYLSVLLNLIFRQQRYLVSDIEKVVKS